MKLFLLVICLLIKESITIDFTTIGQKEIVDYIQNRADLLHGTKLSERNLQDLLSNAVFTGLEEEALIFAYGSAADSGQDIDPKPSQLAVLASSVDSSDSVPLKIFLTSDTLGTTNIAFGGLTTTKSSSSKSSVGDFIINCVQQESFDSTSLDGSIAISLGEATDSHNLALNKTIYLVAEVNVTSLGSNWEASSSSLLTNEGKLLSMLNSQEGLLYIVTYQSLIRETIQANEGDLFGGLKTSGKVLVIVNSNGEVSLSGRTISGKIEASWGNEAVEHVDQFLTINGSKSRRFIVSDIKNRMKNSRLGQRYGSTKGIWNFWDDLFDGMDTVFDGVDTVFDHLGSVFEPGRHEPRPTRPTVRPTKRPPIRRRPTEKLPLPPVPVKVTQKPQVTPQTTPKPIETIKPVMVTTKVEPEVEVTTMKMTTQTTMKPEEKPDLSEPDFTGLPKGATISLWSTRII